MKKWILLIGCLATTGWCKDLSQPQQPTRLVRSTKLAVLLQATRVGEVFQYKNLGVYPLYTKGCATTGYWTLDEALAKGVLRISEKGAGNVPELLVENEADAPVFLMAGEIVRGGKQNRVISQDVLLPPRSGPISLGVFCVEQHRWRLESQNFKAESDLAHGRLRETLNAPTVSQGAVWGEVARKSAAVAAEVPNATQYLGKIYEDKDVSRTVADYTAKIRIPAEANGMVVTIGNRVVGLEIFGDRETFASLRDKLLRSYAVDAMENVEETKSPPSRFAIDQFICRAQLARLFPKPSLGLGRLQGVEARGIYGTMLVWDELTGAQGVVHASLFAGEEIRERLPIVPRPLPRADD